MPEFPPPVTDPAPSFSDQARTQARKDPSDYRNWLYLGWTAGDPVQALAYFREALRLQPGDPVILDSIAWATSNLPPGVSPGEFTEAAPADVAVELTAQSVSNETALLPIRSEFPLFKPRNLTVFLVALFYLLGITLAEALTSILSLSQVGLVIHSVLVVILIAHGAFLSHGRVQQFLFALVLVPLIRLMSLSVPLIHFDMVYWYAIIGAPLLVAAFVAARLIHIDFRQAGLLPPLRGLPLQLLFGLIGVGLGYVEYLILKPAPLARGLTPEQFWAPALILTVFTGFLEEYIFRALLQQTSMILLGGWGMVYTALIFAVMHLGYQSASDFTFVFFVAILFGLFVGRTRSIVGATLAHALTNIGLFLVFPFMIATGPQQPINIATFLTPTPTITPSPTATYTLTPINTSTPFRPATPTSMYPTDTRVPYAQLLTQSAAQASATPTAGTVTPQSSQEATPAVTQTPPAGITLTPAITTSLTPSLTATPAPSLTLEASATPTLAVPSSTPTSTPTSTATAAPTSGPAAAPTATPVNHPPLDLIVDDGDPGFLRQGGTQWYLSSGYGGDLVWAPPDVKPSAIVVWHPLITVCGWYELSVYLSPDLRPVPPVTYRVIHSGGDTSVVLTPQMIQGSWAVLGRFRFDNTQDYYLHLTNLVADPQATPGFVVFDAARWTFVEGCSP